MEIGKYQLVFFDKSIFLFNRLLYFNDHLSDSENFFGRGQNFCASTDIFLLTESAAFTSFGLDINRVTLANKFLSARGRDRYPVFIILYLFWYPDDHIGMI